MFMVPRLIIAHCKGKGIVFMVFWSIIAHCKGKGKGVIFMVFILRTQPFQAAYHEKQTVVIRIVSQCSTITLSLQTIQ